MTCPSERPLLFLDIDGPLLPFGAPGTARSGSPVPPDQGNPLLERLDPALGPRLMALGCRLVWASTWMREANEVIAPRLGLPPLPLVEWADGAAGPVPHGLHWKTPHLVSWAGHRPFIWVDDEIGAMDRQWVCAQHPAPALLHRVDPAEGLTDADFRALDGWLRAVAPG